MGVARTIEYVQYPITGPFMNRAVPENQVQPGSFATLVGVDGRYGGCLRKYYGNEEVVDLDDEGGGWANIDAYDGPSFFKYVAFHKRGTADTYRGFLVRWDSQDDNNSEQIDLMVTLDGSTWVKHNVWAARTLAFTSGGTAEIAIGDTITGATSAATAVVDSIILSSGTWAGGDAVGTLNIHTQSGTLFNENLNVAGKQDNIATISTASVNNAITSSLEIDCASNEGFLYVFVDTKSPKTIYWDGSALTTVDMGPGAFSATLGALTASTDAVDSSYNLTGDGVFQVAWRFYDSVRGIYSALSDPLTITLDHMKTTKATGTVSFNDGGSDSGLMVAGDIITINSRTYEYIDSGSDVTISAAGAATIAAHAIALADAINGDSSAVVSARAEAASVLLESKTRGATGNSYDLSVTETGSDMSVSSSTLTGGGDATTEAEEHCKATLDFPANGAVVSGSAYADFTALFDTVDVFRTINLGTGATAVSGAIFYLEQTISKDPDWDTNSAEWDALQVTIGTKVDEALPFQTMYNPETDIVSTPPSSGAVGRYQGITFAGEAATITPGLNTYHSSLEHESGEYFTTFNKKKHDITEGRPMRYLSTGDSMFVLCPNAVTHVFKSAKTRPLQFVTLHQSRGLAGKGAAHVVGNSIFMITGTGLVMLNGTDGSMGQISAVNRLLAGGAAVSGQGGSSDWVGYLDTIESGYDALMNASFFLCPNEKEILQVYHSTQSTSLLQGANFVGVASGPDVTDGKNVRAYFITATGLIVAPDHDVSGSIGTMWGISATPCQLTTNGTQTGADSKTAIIMDAAVFHADMIGCLIYCTKGANQGGYGTITAVNVGTYTLTVSGFSVNFETGDTFSINPVPFKVRLWPLRDPDPRADNPFKRWVVSSMSVKLQSLVPQGQAGWNARVNNEFRVTVFRNTDPTGIVSAIEAFIPISRNPTDCSVALSIDGITIEPYIDYLGSGVSFELTNVEVGVKMTDSRDVTAN